jgi:hypothetical protein
MNKTILLLGLICFVMIGYSQTTTENKKTNGIKIGTFFQNDFYYAYDHYDYDYYTRYRRTVQGGYFYIAYDYSINYSNRKAISFEPKIGLMLVSKQTGIFAGNDSKFFWYSNDFFSIGASFYIGYRYINMDRTETISMENGMYQQILNYTADIHNIDMGISMIPFKFNFSKSGLSLESDIGMGVSWSFENPQNSQFNNFVYQELNKKSFHPYFPKLGIKLGYTFK